MMVHRHLPAAQLGWLRHWVRPRVDQLGILLHRPGCAGTGSRLLTAVALLFVTACATQAKYRTYVDGFVGKNADQLYATWGAPLRSANTPDGGQVVSFLTNVQSGRGFGVAGCETSFILGRDGMVRQASFRGDACYTG